jgi:hypothetical protein
MLTVLWYETHKKDINLEELQVYGKILNMTVRLASYSFLVVAVCVRVFCGVTYYLFNVISGKSVYWGQDRQ